MATKITSRKAAEKRLCELSAMENREIYDNLTKAEYLSILPFICGAEYYSSNVTLRIAVKKFLYYGAVAFNKFRVPPSSFVVTAEDFDNFQTLLDKLWEEEGDDSGNAPIMELNLIRWELYHCISINSEQRDLNVDLDKFVDDARNCTVTDEYANRRTELDDAREKIYQLIDGFKHNTLKTKIHTSLPSLLTPNNSTINFKMEEVDVCVILKPIPRQAENTFMSSLPGSNSLVKTNGSSHWQNGITEIEITINALFDDSYFAKPLMLKEDYSPQTEWNSLYTFTYEVVEKLWMYFRSNDIDTLGQIPSPKDIPFIRYEVHNNEFSIDWKLTQNPTYTISISPMPITSVSIDDFDFDFDIPWYKRSFEYAFTYVQQGQFRDAIFWLNVSTESLVWLFAKSQLSEDLFAELTNGSPVFESAEAILIDQYPKMAGKVNWGDATKVTSIYVVLKRTVKENGLAINYRRLHKYYSDIKDCRNDLVHGSDIEITVEVMAKAMLAYKSFKEMLSQYI